MGLGVSITPAWGWVIAFIGLFFFIPGIKEWLKKRKIGYWPIGLALNSFRSAKPELGYTPLLSAIIELFEEQKRSYVLQRAKQNSEAGQEVLTDSQIVARHIASHICLYGKLRGSHEKRPELRIIPKAALETHRFNDDASRLTHLFYESNYYDYIHVKTDEFEAFKNRELISKEFYAD